MKWMKAVLIAISVGMLWIVSCGDDSSPTGPQESELLGTWRDEEQESEITLHAGGTFEDVDDEGVVQTGTWKLRGKTLTLTYVDDIMDFELTYSSKVSISGDTMTLTMNCGSIRGEGDMAELAVPLVEMVCGMAPTSTLTRQE